MVNGKSIQRIRARSPDDLRFRWQDQPLHVRVRESILQDLIRTGGQPGLRYGTEGELAVRLGVSRNTLRKAVAELEEKGVLSRRKRVGVLIGKRPPLAARLAEAGDIPVSATVSAGLKSRLMVVLPAWNDSVQGFFSGQFLRALSSSQLQPPFAIEIRHHDDFITPSEAAGAAIVAVDPDPRMVANLRDLDRYGMRVIVSSPRQLLPDLVGIETDRRSAVSDAVKKLHRMGHRAIGLMNHDLGHLGFQLCLQGYLDAHRELNRPVHPKGIVQVLRLNPLVDPAPDVTAITAWICAYLGSVDVIARECRKHGLSVPEDVSVISLDDPGETPVPSLGKRVSVVCDDGVADTATIHRFLNDWRENRRGTVTLVPSRWIDRETIAPPRSHR